MVTTIKGINSVRLPMKSTVPLLFNLPTSWAKLLLLVSTFLALSACNTTATNLKAYETNDLLIVEYHAFGDTTYSPILQSYEVQNGQKGSGDKRFSVFKTRRLLFGYKQIQLPLAYLDKDYQSLALGYLGEDNSLRATEFVPIIKGSQN